PDRKVEYDAPNVLYIPGLTDTLLSIGEITREGHTAIFKGNAVEVQFDKGSSLEVERKHGLYALDAKPRIVDEQVLTAKTDAIDKANLWHYRLGHPSHNVTKCLGFKVLEDKCKACKMAKSHRQPFNKQMLRMQEALRRIHSDLIGPLSPEASGSYQGAKYVLPFIDDYSRFAFVHFLSKKDEVFMTFKG